MNAEALPEQTLWQVLDEHRFQFRSPYRDLIADYTLAETDPWCPDTGFASFGQKRDLVDGLAWPMHFDFTTGYRNSANLPRRIKGAVRQSDDEHVNYRLAVEQLSDLLGEGQDSGSRNTLSRTWVFGHASVTARIFPRRLNKPDPHNDRHRLDPQSVTECSIVIETGYCAAPNDEEREALSSIRILTSDPALPLVRNRPAWSEYTRRLSSSACLEHYGFGLGPEENFGGAYSEQFFIQRSAPEFFEIIPRDKLTGGVAYHQSVPDRGAGDVRVCIGYRNSAGGMSELTLVRAGYERDLYRNFAIRLNHSLFTGYTETQTPFCDRPPDDAGGED